MGNNLCRERIARADNSKSPIDRIIGRCAQICPSNEVKSNYWQKHVLETGTPTRTQPQSTMNDGWRKVTLTVPNGKITDESNLGETPVAPPRRKRSSVIVDRQPCGFKELFGNNVSRRSSCDSILKDDNPLTEREQEILQHKRKSKSISDFNLNEIKPVDSLSISTIRIPVTRTLSLMERAMVQQTTTPVPRPTLQRKVSRVGNKKSDKFFGENLSDCLSDDPITPEPEPTSISFTYHTISTLITPIPHASVDGKDKLDDFIDSNVSVPITAAPKINSTAAIEMPTPRPFIIGERFDTKQINVDDKKSSLDKKAEFLMAMLEGTSSYSSIEEPKSPPRRSHLKKRNSSTAGTDSANNQENVVEQKVIAPSKSEVNEKIQINKYNDDEHYKGMTPVEEPLIVPRKRPTRHICDDDHHHIQKYTEHNHAAPKENKQSELNEPVSDKDIEQYIIQQVINSPEKPKRDLSVYEKSKQVIAPTVASEPIAAPVHVVETVNHLAKPVPRVRHLSQENLLSNKLLPSKSNDTIDLMRLKSMQNNINNNNNTDHFDLNKFNGNDRLESLLKKYTSQQSFFTQELLSQIADRVYGFSDPFEAQYSYDDGSSKYTPNSKLTTRKVSVHRKESTVTRPIFENEHELDVTPVETAPKIVQMEEKSVIPDVNGNECIVKDLEQTKITENNIKNTENRPIFIDGQVKRDIENFIAIERNNSEVCDHNDNTEAVANANENVIATIVQVETIVPFPEAKIELNSEQKDVTSAANHVLDDIYKNNNTILGEFQKNLNGNTTVTEQISNCDKSEHFTSSDDENTDSDITVKEVTVVKLIEPKIEHQKPITFANLGAGAKRGSIVEVDAWFLKHNELSNLPRRGSESNTGYDTRKVFPFGKSDPGAGSEFFENKLTLSKSAENILNDNVTKAEQTAEQNGNLNENSSTNDHSILLKYLK